jgi:hypothetical protein
METHYGIACDNCSKQNFSGRRYQCLTCKDYDLCETCYQIRFQFHTQFHQFKRVKLEEAPYIPPENPIYPPMTLFSSSPNIEQNIKR